MKFVLSTFSALLLTSSFAFANAGGSIGGVEGKILVNSGKGFELATEARGVRSGDKIMIGADSQATLTFGKCTTVLSQPGVVTVSKELACTSQATVMPVADLDPVAAPVFPFPPVFFLIPATVIGAGCVALCDEIFGEDNVVPPPAS